MTTRELESTKMEAKESFADFVKRWRAKAALMTECPSEKDQLRIISRNLHLDYVKHLVLVQASANFETFFESGLAIEDALQSGIPPREESSSSNPQKSKSSAYSGNSSALFNSSNYASTATSGDNATASPNPTTDINQVQNAQSFRARTQPRSFSAFEASLSAVMEKLVKSGISNVWLQLFLPKSYPSVTILTSSVSSTNCLAITLTSAIVFDMRFKILLMMARSKFVQSPTSLPTPCLNTGNQPKPIVFIPSEPEVNMMAVGWAIEVFTADIWFDSDEGLTKEKTDWLRSIDQRSIE
ncbi:hypothetical protein RHMOL_Rhmol07G0218000 [Rhododendron molle]|uniref:Uncharacterized protein n=1 Tax=Rhododendron molle TaxID=49168 RepID=A0ACC0N3H9_RHOML|nr:hypothetical protein RHMOL_Rhmol07G0218000 [Rhododendron molle]